MLPQKSIKDTQLGYPRVRAAYLEKEGDIKKLFHDKKLLYPGFNLFIRVFKQEALLEVWIKSNGYENYTLLHVYDVCAGSGTYGPKRKEGDFQVPEGVYSINHFNPSSNFYLSLGLNYPNASDRILSDKHKPGGQIYIHGNCVTVGCLPLTDDKIKELYVLAIEARNNGQDNIPVHIFPCRMSSTRLAGIQIDYPGHVPFWNNLQPVYDDFEKTKKLSRIVVNSKGEYQLKAE